MSATVYKYHMPMPGMRSQISMPAGAKFLSTGVENNSIVAWFEVDLSQSHVMREFEVYPTGMTFAGGQYLGTQILGGWYVGHLYEVGR